MYTLGFPFAPWKDPSPVADGPAIYKYIEDTANKFNITEKIQFNHRATAASFSSAEGRWTVSVDANGRPKTIRAKYIFWCSGYYSYTDPYKADIKGLDSFKGKVVHPQFWDEDLDYTNKEVVVIGSGATAVTLLPAMADKVKHITMLQRSPAYFVAMPKADPTGKVVRLLLPGFIANPIMRFIWASKYFLFFKACRAFPNMMRRILLFMAKWHLDKNTPIDPHFTPDYKPWDQRICFVPDGDMFASIRSGKASVVTDHLENVTESGINLKSGQKLNADIIIPATGLEMQFFGGAKILVDGKDYNPGEHFFYKGFMLDGAPSMFVAMGYTTISWSLGCDLIAQHACKIVQKLEKEGKDYVVATPKKGVTLEETATTNLKSGYLQRAASKLPKAATSGPWYMRSNYFYDRWATWLDSCTDSLEYKNAHLKSS